jgi:hypothetical protein
VRVRFSIFKIIYFFPVASIILENPFYGLRKPKDQFRSSLQQVSDLFVMGVCLILESLVLFHWCERENFSPIVLTGISMGGHMASLSATIMPKPICLIPCLSWTSASLTFTKGVMTGALPWDLLEKQYAAYNAYKDEVVRMMIEYEDSQMDKVAQLDEHRDKLYLRGVNDDPSASLKYTNLVEEHTSSLTSKLLFKPLNTAEQWAPSVLFNMLPEMIRNDLKYTTSQKDSLHREAVHFMDSIMNECTHLRNFSKPLDPSLIFIVVAENDAYQPRDGISALPEIWPGANMRYIEGKGHVSSYLLKQDVFRQAIYDSIDSFFAKYPRMNT